MFLEKRLLGYICLVCYWLHWCTDTFVLYVIDYTGGRIHFSCLLLTTLEYGYICLVCYWLHWSTGIFVLYVTDNSGVRIHVSCTDPDYTGVRIYFSGMLLTTLESGYMCLVLFLTTLEYGYISLVCYWLHLSTDARVLYCSWLHWSTDLFLLYVTDYIGVQIHVSCTVPDYTGVRIHLSCMFLTTLEYGYISLVCYWLHWITDTCVLSCSWLH